jgi:hypothetical protein
METKGINKLIGGSASVFVTVLGKRLFQPFKKRRIDEIRNTVFPISPIPTLPEERPELCKNRNQNAVKYKQRELRYQKYKHNQLKKQVECKDSTQIILSLAHVINFKYK